MMRLGEVFAPGSVSLPVSVRALRGDSVWLCAGSGQCSSATKLLIGTPSESATGWHLALRQ
jgi:hypothetical protein